MEDSKKYFNIEEYKKFVEENQDEYLFVDQKILKQFCNSMIFASQINSENIRKVSFTLQ